MEAIPINNIEGEKVVTHEGATKRIKRFLAKIIKAVSDRYRRHSQVRGMALSLAKIIFGSSSLSGC